MHLCAVTSLLLGGALGYYGEYLIADVVQSNSLCSLIRSHFSVLEIFTAVHYEE